MQGFTGSFAVNGTQLLLQPSEFSWENPAILGRDGYGKAVYPAFTEFRMSWGLMSNGELKQLIDFAEAILVTGTAVVDLPQWRYDGYYFLSYSGTHLNRPEVGAYFNEYVTDVRWIVSNIRTS